MVTITKKKSVKKSVKKLQVKKKARRRAVARLTRRLQHPPRRARVRIDDNPFDCITTSPLFGPAVGGKRGKVLSREALSRIEKDKVEFARILKLARHGWPWPL